MPRDPVISMLVNESLSEVSSPYLTTYQRRGVGEKNERNMLPFATLVV